MPLTTDLRHAPVFPDRAKSSGLERPARLPLGVVEEAARPVPEVLLSLRTSADGLTSIEALARRGREGLNEIAHEGPPRWYVQLLQAFKNPFILLLLVLALVSLATEDYKAASVIGVMVTISVLLRFVQEYRSGQAAARLQAMVSTTASVTRPPPRAEVPAEAAEAFGVQLSRTPRREEVPIQLLVPGDVIHLSAGDMVPADVRLLSTKDLFVSQSALTGESMPVEKSDMAAAAVARLLPQLSSPLDLPNVCFMGTNVVSGIARAVVVATGEKTYLGSLARHIAGKRPLTSFDRGVNSVCWLLIRFMLVMVPLVFVLIGWTRGDWVGAFFFGLAVAVGLTPEMLPMIVTANLARGAVSLSRRQVIVKRQSSIQNFGAMDVLCTDKTGTLTQDRVILLRHLGVNGEEDEDVFEYAFLNSYFQTGLKNLLDRAVLEHEDLVQTKDLPQRYIKCDEVPFDFQRRRMSVIVHEVFRGRDLLLCKGAVEEVVAVCDFARVDGQVVPLSDGVRELASHLAHGLNEDGLRVIAVAYKQVDSQPGKQYGVADEASLVLCGYIAFLDPPKETAGPALEALRAQGVAVKILTGDNERVARKVCKDVGLADPPTLLGNVIDAMSDPELEAAVEETTLFAKLTPPQKARVIRALKHNDHTVGFLGDGINDAPALREADVGISVDTGADIARESADIILLEKSLLVLERGVTVGRVTYGNIIKYIKMAASSNFGNMFSVLGASLWLPFLPMLPLQLLIQNLLYDLSQVAIPFDGVDKEFSSKPRQWQVGDVGRFMLFIGPVSSLFDFTTFALLWFVFGANTVGAQGLFQTGWFIEGLLSQTLIIHMIRTAKVPFFQSMASLPLTLLTLAIMGAGVAIPFTVLGTMVGLQPPPPTFFPWLTATLLSYCALTQAVKVWYIRRFGMWL
jgi:Mg2+-importing ATPase